MNDEKPLFLESFGNILSLNRTHKASLNLVTLSACQTALGDDRAALGLGGLAFRIGAHSVVATLWKIRSDFTTQFMPLFYQKINSGKI